jgi:hypothetical protein
LPSGGQCENPCFKQISLRRLDRSRAVAEKPLLGFNKAYRKNSLISLPALAENPCFRQISLTAEAKMPMGKHFHGLSAGETPKAARKRVPHEFSHRHAWPRLCDKFSLKAGIFS